MGDSFKNNPNTDSFPKYISSAKSQPTLLCSPLSITFCNPVNHVQMVAKNIAGKYFSYSSNQLADLFDQGKRIDVDAYSGFIPNACRQEVELLFNKASHT
ncbi:MAG: hypothetical protein NTZ74_13820 [Chloroflexi bacterium]|nr:hypothetical protein [Chloroflexota bacterium]